MAKPTEFEKYFSQGYMCALCGMIKSHGIDTPIVEAFKANKLSKKQLDTYDIDESDKETLLANWKELNRIR